MKTPRPRRKDKPLARRLAGYSSTAGAALLCAAGAELAFPVEAHAITNLTSANLTPTTPGTFHSSGANFTFAAGPFQLVFFGNNRNITSSHLGYVRGESGGNSALRIAATSAGSAALALNLTPHVSPLEAQVFHINAVIGSANPTAHGIASSGAGASAIGYVGFKDVFSAGHTSYAWLRVRLTNDANGFVTEFSLVPDGDGIYGAYAPKGENLIAGETAPVPEPTTAALAGLALLALGSQGIRELRRRRAVA